MKIIGVTQRSAKEVQYSEIRDALDQRWYPFFIQTHILPIILPNCSKLLESYLSHFKFDGFLLTGGDSFAQREKVETQLIDYALTKNLPLIGICHGMQMIQRYFNVQLEKVIGHIQNQQQILIENQKEMVNSYHDYGTTQTVPELLIWAQAKDGVVKAVKHIHNPLYGLMWHPERMSPFRPKDIELFKHILGERNESCDFSSR